MGLLEAINRTLRLCTCGVGSAQPQSSGLLCRGVMRVQEGREALQCLQLGWVPVLRCATRDTSLHTEASRGRTHLGAPWSHHMGCSPPSPRVWLPKTSGGGFYLSAPVWAKAWGTGGVGRRGFPSEGTTQRGWRQSEGMRGSIYWLHHPTPLCPETVLLPRTGGC